MKKVVPVLALLALGVFSASAQAVPHSSAQGLSHRNSCAVQAADSARCFAKVVTKSDGATFSPNGLAGSPAGWWPQDLQSAYNLPAFTGAPTVAIVDAYDDPNAESDLATYRSQFNLPPCTSAPTGNGCFTKVNQTGGSTMPPADKGWAEEISLDLDMVSSACPSCHILLVEATSNSFANLMTAVDYATAHAVAVSNSYGANEFLGETTYDSHFNKPGVAITVSSGDNGYGAEYPASSQYVTATGGTSLSSTSTGRHWSETAWSGAGSGCSAYEPKPSWQQGGATPSACGRRTVADVSSVSNPNTGVAVYDTYGGDPGWMVFGGTSAAAPFIAGVYAVGGVLAAPTQEASLPYSHKTSLFDVTSGSNGRCTTGGKRGSSSTAYLCTAGAGYDGPTGLGTPNGAGAF